MAKVSWSFNIDGNPHIIVLEHKGWSGTRTITLDGRLVMKVEHSNNNGNVYQFDAFGNRCTVSVSTWFLPCQYGLEVDGVPIPEDAILE